MKIVFCLSILVACSFTCVWLPHLVAPLFFDISTSGYIVDPFFAIAIGSVISLILCVIILKINPNIFNKNIITHKSSIYKLIGKSVVKAYFYLAVFGMFAYVASSIISLSEIYFVGILGYGLFFPLWYAVPVGMYLAWVRHIKS